MFLHYWHKFAVFSGHNNAGDMCVRSFGACDVNNEKREYPIAHGYEYCVLYVRQSYLLASVKRYFSHNICFRDASVYSTFSCRHKYCNQLR